MSAAFHHLVVPTDGSDIAQNGVNVALDLAAPDGRMTFCSVVDATRAFLPGCEGAAFDPGPMLEALSADAEMYCELARSCAQERALTSDVEVLHGSCVGELDALVRRTGADAVVIGTHGRTGLPRAVLGSVAEGLLRCSDVPIIAVHDHDVRRDGPIAVAVDASRASHCAVDTAIGIARARQTSLALVHVLDADHDETRAHVALGTAAARARELGIASTITIRTGNVADAVLETVDEMRCAMVAVGTHGREGIARFFLGSVAVGLVARARVPVVAVRRGEPPAYAAVASGRSERDDRVPSSR